MKNTHPNWLHLMELWLQTHHKGQPAVIFSNPLLDPMGVSGRVERLKKLFPDMAALVGAEFAVLGCPSHEEASRIMRETPNGDPYTLVWDGSKITGHH